MRFLATAAIVVTVVVSLPATADSSDPHWAYQSPRRPAISGGAHEENPVDAFLRDAHEREGLVPVAPAPRDVLLRRVAIDLTGLPPTRAELHEFTADDSPGAYERVVDRLLASPRYAERWARHWMDIWRYSDWAGWGNQIRYSQYHIWRWREWIIDAVERDKGYDRMILEMLAADELAPGDEAAVRATGFLARNWYKFDRNVWLDDTIEHTFKAFLATTVNCARCHDHKYDPIAQEEYYRLRAIFEPYEARIDRVPGELDTAKSGLARVYDSKLAAPTFLFERGDPKSPAKDRPLGPGVPAALGAECFEVEPVSLPIESSYPALRGFVIDEMLESAKRVVADASAMEKGELRDARVAAAKAELAALRARLAAERAKYIDPGVESAELAACASDAQRRAELAAAEAKHVAAKLEHDRLARASSASPEDTKAKKKAESAAKALAEAAKALETARDAVAKEGSSYAALGPVYPRASTGRRLALARWIVDRRNPLTARVAVNHIWNRHFGRPLVDDVVDFGLRSSRPTLLPLLDFLAIELVENGWSTKHIHRLIVTSEVYRRSSSTRDAAVRNLEIDPENALFWRANSRRMEAETVRDAVLWVSGGLDVTRGGPELDQSKGFDVPRRSLWFRHARQRQMEFLTIFDAANPRECYRRKESVRPQQAFALINSSLAIGRSRVLARRLSDENVAGDVAKDAVFIAAAFESVLSRRPSEAELRKCGEYLRAQTIRLADPSKLVLVGTAENAVPASTDPARRARENLVLALLNHHEFVTVR